MESIQPFKGKTAISSQLPNFGNPVSGSPDFTNWFHFDPSPLLLSLESCIPKNSSSGISKTPSQIHYQVVFSLFIAFTRLSRLSTSFTQVLSLRQGEELLFALIEQRALIMVTIPFFVVLVCPMSS
jgi:hypothetical protein